MKVHISFEFDSAVTDSDNLVAWLNATLTGGEPVKTKKAQKPRKPMTDEEKAAFRARMVKGQQEAAKARKNGDSADLDAEEVEEVQPDPEKIAKAEAAGEAAKKGSKSTAAKKPAPKSKPAIRKKTTTASKATQ